MTGEAAPRSMIDFRALALIEVGGDLAARPQKSPSQQARQVLISSPDRRTQPTNNESDREGWRRPF